MLPLECSALMCAHHMQWKKVVQVIYLISDFGVLQIKPFLANIINIMIINRL